MIGTNLTRLTLIFLFFIFNFYGCVTSTKKEIISHKPGAVSSILPVKTIDRTIGELEEIIKTTNLSQDERRIINNFLSACKELKSFNKGGLSDFKYTKAIEGILTGIQRVCERLKMEKSEGEKYSRTHVINEFFLKKKEIDESFLAEDYNKVITHCIELEKRFGKNSLTPEIGLLFSISLAENGRLTEAISVGEGILKDLGARPNLIHLRSNIIDWELKMGNREKALEIYEKLIDNMDEMDFIFNRISKRITADNTDDIPETGLDMEEVIGELDKAHSTEFQGNLDIVKRLIGSKSYEEAKLFLLRWRLRAEEGPEIDIIEKTLKIVELAEAKLNYNLDNERQIINDAKGLIEGERYKEALSILEPLTKANDEINHDALKLKELAVEKLIDSERLKAGKYYRDAKNSSDPAEKEALLKSSIEILSKLIEKYPSSPLINKLNREIMKVRNMLDDLMNKAP